MNTTSIESLLFNNTNTICSSPFAWDQATVDSRKPELVICIVAVFIHSVFWLQLVFCSSVRQKSMQWIYAYLITDIFLLGRFFFTYIVHTTSTDCHPPQAWILFVCYFDAVVDNYFNILEVYILLALNICRYIQIAYNKSVYRLHVKSLIVTHLVIYVLPLIYTIVPFPIDWTQLDMDLTSECEVLYANIPIQIFNIVTAFALPIVLNILVIGVCIRHVHLTSSLQRGQHHVSARDKYHRSLVIQFLVFYTIWVVLWSPNIIVYQIAVYGSELTSTVRRLNFIEIALDPMIIAALDVRFWKTWKNLVMHSKHTILKNLPTQVRIQPTGTNLNAFTLKTPQLKTTTFHSSNV